MSFAVPTSWNHVAQLRHTTPQMTLGVYVQERPGSVRTAVEALDQIVYQNLWSFSLNAALWLRRS